MQCLTSRLTPAILLLAAVGLGGAQLSPSASAWSGSVPAERGRTRDHRTVLVPGGEELIGRYLTVELTGTTGSTFTGAIVTQRRALPMAG